MKYRITDEIRTRWAREPLTTFGFGAADGTTWIAAFAVGFGLYDFGRRYGVKSCHH